MAGGGFRPYNCLGAPSTQQTMEFWITNGETKDIFQYDLITMTSEGEIDPVSANSEEQLLGSFVGCEYTNADGQRIQSNFYNGDRAQDGMVAHVLVNPFQLYLAKWQTNAAADSTKLRTAIGLNFDLDFVAGSLTSGRSGMAVETTQAGTTAQAMVRCVGVTNVDGADNPKTAIAGTTTYTHGIFMIDPLINFFLGEAVGI